MVRGKASGRCTVRMVTLRPLPPGDALIRRRGGDAFSSTPRAAVPEPDPGDWGVDASARLSRALSGPLRQALHHPLPGLAALRDALRPGRDQGGVHGACPTSSTPARARGCSSRWSGKNSVILLDEGPHMEQRKLMLPAFHGEKMARLARPDGRGGRAGGRQLAARRGDRAAPAAAAPDAGDHPAGRLRPGPGPAPRRASRAAHASCSPSATGPISLHAARPGRLAGPDPRALRPVRRVRAPAAGDRRAPVRADRRAAREGSARARRRARDAARGAPRGRLADVARRSFATS